MILVLAPSPALDVTYLLERVDAGAIHRPREVLRSAGGKGLNLARAAVTLGAEARVVAGLGGGIGALVRELAEADGIRIDAVPVAATTRQCVSAIPDDGGAPTEFYEPAVELSDDEWAVVEQAVERADADWIVVAGRLPESALDRVGTLLARRREAGARVAIDSSGSGLAALVDRVRPELVKVNRAEAAELLGAGGDAGAGSASAGAPGGDVLALARGVARRSTGAVVVTDGAAGAVAVGDSGAWRAHPDPEPGRFAIGSGDSFLAGLLAALEGRAGLGDALAEASAAGSANTRRPGAARFAREDVDAALGRIRVEAIA